MDKKRLRQYIVNKREVDQLIEQIRSLEDRATSLQATRISGLPSSHADNHAAENAIIKIADLHAKYEKMIADLLGEQIEIEECIASVRFPIERRLLRERYINGKLWEDVAESIGYSLKQTHRIHASALQNIQGDDER